jgi:hypothetical protein
VRQYRIATAPRTRLACVKHAASVRSEPGSNSRLKPVAWDKKSPPKTSGEPADPSKLLSLDLLKPFALEKGEWHERILAHRIDCQRAISPPVQQKGRLTTERVYEHSLRLSTADFREIHRGLWESHPRSLYFDASARQTMGLRHQLLGAKLDCHRQMHWYSSAVQGGGLILPLTQRVHRSLMKQWWTGDDFH